MATAKTSEKSSKKEAPIGTLELTKRDIFVVRGSLYVLGSIAEAIEQGSFPDTSKMLSGLEAIENVESTSSGGKISLAEVEDLIARIEAVPA